VASRAVEPAPLRIDPHNTERGIRTAVSRLESEQDRLSRPVVREILSFVRARETEVSRQRTLTYLRILPLAAEKLGPDFLAPNRETPQKLRNALSSAKGWTLASYWAVLSRFWRWRFERAGKDFPPALHLTVAKRFLARKDESVVLTVDEVARIASATTTVRDKAFVWVLYESGGRAGEILGLRLRDVARSEHGGFLLHLDGKTGKRTVPLFEASVPALSAWLTDHPGRENPDAPLWCGVQATDRLAEPIGYAGMVKVLRHAGARAGVRKRVNPHSFRHSRATEVAKNPQISTSVLERFFGWRPGSPMAETYVHLSGKEVEELMARAIGADTLAAPRVSSTLPRKCGRCENVNDATSKFCGRCASPLDLSAEEEVERVGADARVLARLLNQPRVREFLARELARSTSVARGRGGSQLDAYPD
jgi:integrase/recombinase XerD